MIKFRACMPVNCSQRWSGNAEVSVEFSLCVLKFFKRVCNSLNLKVYSFEWKLKSKKSELAFEYGICKLEKSRQNFNSNNEYLYLL